MIDFEYRISQSELVRCRIVKKTSRAIWTEYEVTLLKNIWKQKTYAELSIIFGRSKKSIEGKATRLNLPKKIPCWNAEEIFQLMKTGNVKTRNHNAVKIKKSRLLATLTSQ